MERIDRNKANLKSLLQLISDNPNLRVIPLVDGEIIEEEGPQRWFASLGKTSLDEILEDDAHVFIRSDDEDELIYTTAEECLDADETMSEQEAEDFARTLVANRKWEKVILVQINQYC